MRAMPVPQKDGPRANRDIRGVREVQLIDRGQGRTGAWCPFRCPASSPRTPASTSSRSRRTRPRPSARSSTTASSASTSRRRPPRRARSRRPSRSRKSSSGPSIDDHDYDVKMKAMQRLLRGRRQGQGHAALPRPRDGAPAELGLRLLERVKAETADHRQGRERAAAGRPPDDHGPGAALGLTRA